MVGHDEENYIEALETVRATLTEGRKAAFLLAAMSTSS